MFDRLLHTLRADGQGFEPWRRFRANTLSRPDARSVASLHAARDAHLTRITDHHQAALRSSSDTSYAYPPRNQILAPSGLDAVFGRPALALSAMRIW